MENLTTHIHSFKLIVFGDGLVLRKILPTTNFPSQKRPSYLNEFKIYPYLMDGLKYSLRVNPIAEDECNLLALQ